MARQLRSRIVQTLNVPLKVRLGPSLAAALLGGLFLSIQREGILPLGAWPSYQNTIRLYVVSQEPSEGERNSCSIHTDYPTPPLPSLDVRT
jgi:hypothetical protein